MSNLNISKFFCEVLSGLAILFLILPLFAILKVDIILVNLMNSYDLDIIITYILEVTTLSTIAILLTLSYLLGIIIDAIGLAMGDCFIDNWF